MPAPSLRYLHMALSVLAILICGFFSETAFSKDDVIQAVLAKIANDYVVPQMRTEYSMVKAQLGEPLQIKAIETGGKVAVWKLDTYSIDGTFNQNNVLTAFGYHWFGLQQDMPNFGDLLDGDYEVENNKGSRRVKIDGEALQLDWSIKPVPKMDKKISVLSFMLKNS